MITENTVFILGAGASCPYGFPSGAGLRDDICCNFRTKFLNFLKTTGKFDIEYRLEACDAFSKTFFNSSTKSIDLFIARNPHLAESGKYAIALEILDAEINSHFNEQSKHSEDWLFYLFDRMANTTKDKTQIKKFSENNISFITFNYDRSLEHFFYTSLRNSFDIPEYEILNISKQLKIIHVYGSLAPLDWQNNENGIKYGAKISEYILQRISQNLRTIYEEKQNPELDEAKKLIAEANRVFFLGLGYADENMNILGLPQTIRLGAKIFGTGLGLEQKEAKDVENKIRNGLTGDSSSALINKRNIHKVVIENMDCLKLLRNYL